MLESVSVIPAKAGTHVRIGFIGDTVTMDWQVPASAGMTFFSRCAAKKKQGLPVRRSIPAANVSSPGAFIAPGELA